jgi:DNA polymerase-3 subunit beta
MATKSKALPADLGKPARKPILVSVGRDDFAGAVSWAARALPARPTAPVLAGLRLRHAGGRLAVEGFDYEISAAAQVPTIGGGDDAQILVPGRLLNEIVGALPSYPVDLTDDGTRATLRCGRAVFELNLLPDEEYPRLPEMPAVAGKIGADLFAAAAAQVACAAGKDDTLPALTGVKVTINGKLITLVATDRYRLAIRELQWEPVDPAVQADLLIPAKVLADVAKAMTSEATVEISLGAEGIAGFAGGHRRLTTRLLSGEFPKYGQLIPTEFSATAELACGPLARAVKMVALVCERNVPVRLSLTGGQVEIAGGAGDDARGSDVLTGDDFTFEGEPLEVAFNPGYFLDAIAGCGDGPLRIAFTTAARPALLTAATAPGYQHILMPIRGTV